MEVHQNEKKNHSVFTFYRYLDKTFITLQIIGAVSAIIGGGLGLLLHFYCFFTGSIFILGKIYTEFDISKSNSELRSDIEDLCWVELMVAGILAVSCCIFFTCLHLVGQKVSYEFRWRYS